MKIAVSVTPSVVQMRRQLDRLRCSVFQFSSRNSDSFLMLAGAREPDGRNQLTLSMISNPPGRILSSDNNAHASR